VSGGDAKPVYVAPPTRCVRLAEIVARDGGSFERREPAERTEYALPAHATAEVATYLRTRAVAEDRERFFARLPEGRVFGSGAVLSARGDWLARDVSEDLGKPFERHWLLGFGKMREPERLTGASAVVAVNLGAGYCHWLLEELPRLLALERGEVDNVVANFSEAFAREAWAWRGGGERVVAARRHGHLACGPLVVPSLADAPCEPTRRSVERVREFAEGLGREAALRAGRGERIYVTREKARRRRVANEAALWAELERRGFAKVVLEEMPWAEQIAVFRAARVVVAPHGAGLANLVFCEPGARVVELVNRDYFNPVFWRVAALRGLDYRAVLRVGEVPIREEASAGGDDVVADLARLCAELSD
jgi:Capsular polysaccharide biosynthesis protein